MPPTPYLFFNGNCAEAMRFYERVLGGKLDPVMTYADSPEGPPPPKVTPDKIMHARLVLPDGGAIMASDDMSGAPYRGMSGFAVTLVYPAAAEVKRVFEALADGGRIDMPLDKTFWSEAFGGVTDRFGTPWMIYAAAEE
ncbi:MAG: VOC family protein [Thermoanaerobaculia bacterium]